MNDKLHKTFYRKIGLFLLLISFLASCSGGGNTTTPPTTFDFICPNGIIADGTTSTANTEKCTDCNAGFTLNTDKCAADAGTFAYVCPNGIIAGGTTATANIEKCTDCNTGFTLSSDKCVASAPSPTFAYICPNGTIADGTTSTSNIEKCTACNMGFTLSSDQCIIVNLISGGDSHTCAIRTGAAFCWGLQTNGRLGNGVATEADITTLTAVTGLSSGVTDISAGIKHTCAIQNGAAKCWGDGTFGQLGTGNPSSSNTPVQVAGLDSGVTEINAGGQHTCAIQNDAVKCWGQGGGKLGRSNTNNSNNPVDVVGLDSGVTHISISAGGQHTCAIQNGAAFCWGQGGEGRLGRGNADTSNIPVAVTGLSSGVTDISAGNRHSCAIQNGVAKCWGYGFRGRLGNGDTENQNTFVNVSDVTSVFTNDNVTSIISGEDTTCAVRNGAAFCWGYGFYGERGDGGSSLEQTTAVQVTGLTSDVTSFDLGSEHTCAVQNNLFKCWGRQLNGRLGNNVVTDTAQATAVDITARFP